jgi:peptidoglycan/LPS O-acetylase OafA/YrhL
VLAEQGLTFAGRWGFAANIAVIAVISGVLAAATYRIVERPALARKVGGATAQRQATLSARDHITSPASSTSQSRRTSLTGEHAGNRRRR